MKKILLFPLFAILVFILGSCEESAEKKAEQVQDKDSKEISLLQKIANANGFQEWKNVDHVSFTFNIDRDTTHFERSWEWKPKENKIKMLASNDTLEYHTNHVEKDSTLAKADQAFINDKYWLLFPFQLVWDQGFTHSIKENVISPLKNEKVTELTIDYNAEDGYTPGDRYKVYIDSNYTIKEWAYYPGASKEPRMTTTWEDYETQKGIKFAKTHKDSTANFKLYFTKVSIR
ncbi:hypothetical protein ACFQ3R_08945 [Mesonia ostreae]|uniref:Lipoprotein n=1 Tax=Mesonia ostreae TaxID=861110 RepID=A0ABU2KET5_9FLAO|nr:hypothetical protein [Mesonia ostreae]MDT0293205.1 hypothetical protein [Mesonia ostreae]